MRQTITFAIGLGICLLLVHALVTPIPTPGWTTFTASAGLCLTASGIAELLLRKTRHAAR